ncbi:hypothetical protein POM88_021632 [Heracleum sosnowskyi]|uniref:EGF-like domain-containing protein n=1 Tax=Heracleum sosnowskyi TaxID=360622 RepID=A0AAD8MSZ2_9APIA|nr:hypothetical protein POM88_021632 [Heracleum sosnowskyi]
MALRTLLAIMRMFWPDGCVGALEIDRKSPRFWNKCINEFLRYYTFDPRFATEAEARASIFAHMRDNLRHTLADDRERADVKIAGASGTTYADHRPLYMKPDDYMEAHDGKLDELVVYKECHTLKDEERKGEWITEDAQKIIGKAPAAENDDFDDGLGNGSEQYHLKYVSPTSKWETIQPKVMASFILHFTSHSSPFNLLLLCLSCINIITTTDSQILPVPLKGLACSIVNCGEGTCKASKATMLGIECDCNPGWKQIPLASFAIPSCVLPNCTVDFHCGSRAPAPPASLPLLPTINASSPCNLVWCGNGDCVVNGNRHYCQCNQGSSNYLGVSSFGCFEPCYFGEDCKNLELGPIPRLPPLHLPPLKPSLQLPPSLPLPPPLPPTPPSSSTSSGSPKAAGQEHEADTKAAESNGAWSNMKNCRALMAVMIALVFKT